MKQGLLVWICCLFLSAAGQHDCTLQVGQMQFAQPAGAAEAYTDESGDTTWRVRYVFSITGKADLLESIYGAMHFHCNGATTKVKSFSLRVEAEKVKLPYVKNFQTNYIVRDKDLEALYSRKQFTIYIDNIRVYGAGHTVAGLAIEYAE